MSNFIYIFHFFPQSDYLIKGEAVPFSAWRRRRCSSHTTRRRRSNFSSINEAKTQLIRRLQEIYISQETQICNKIGIFKPCISISVASFIRNCRIVAALSWLQAEEEEVTPRLRRKFAKKQKLGHLVTRYTLLVTLILVDGRLWWHGVLRFYGQHITHNTSLRTLYFDSVRSCAFVMERWLNFDLNL